MTDGTSSRQFIYDQLTRGADTAGFELPGPQAEPAAGDAQADESEYVSQDEWDSWVATLPPETRAQVEVDPVHAQEMWDLDHPADEANDEEVVADEGDHESDAIGGWVDPSTVPPEQAAYYARVFANEAARGDPAAMEAATFWHQRSQQRERIEAVRRGEMSQFDLNDEDEAQNVREIMAQKIAAGRAKWGPR